MGLDDTPAEHPAPPPPDQRTCRKCNETKFVTPESWVYKPDKKKVYHAHGLVCLACEKKRKAEYEARRDQLAAVVKPAKSVSTEKPDEKRQALTAASKLDAANALKIGSRALNDAAPGILARVLMWSEDEGHEQHAWAVEFLAQRILPRKLYEELGGTAAGGQLADKRPQYVIQILPAQPGAPEGRVVEGQAHVVDITPTE